MLTAPCGHRFAQLAQAEGFFRPEEPALLAPPRLDKNMLALGEKIRHARAIYKTRPLTMDRAPWAVMHSIIAYGVDTPLIGARSGEPVTAIGWLCYNGRTGGMNMFYPRRDGFGVREGDGMQGHAGQLLAILAQAKLQRDYPIKVQGRDYTIEDLINYEQETCHAGTELTFKLIGIAHYRDSDFTWKNERGEAWSIPRLIQEEIKQPIRGAACGGTHRLMGLSYAVQKRAKNGKPIDGEFARAEKYTRQYRAYALSLQNRDGSFSTEWLRGRGERPDLDRRLQTTGHILEWMVFSTPEEQLQDPRIVHSVNYIADLLISGRNREWPIGPLGHALHALKIYERRVFANREIAIDDEDL